MKYGKFVVSNVCGKHLISSFQAVRTNNKVIFFKVMKYVPYIIAFFFFFLYSI